MSPDKIHIRTQEQSGPVEIMLGTSEVNRRDSLSDVWAALLGILGLWLLVGVMCGIAWLVHKYPETSLAVTIALAITFCGAMFGVTAKHGDLGDYWL